MENGENLTAMLVFARVVELQSFSEAARALGLSKSHVSREIARLELRLGIRLLQRTTRRLALTELGQAYYPYCVRMLAEVQRAEAFVQQVHQQPTGHVRLQAPSRSAANAWFPFSIISCAAICILTSISI